MSTLTMRLLRVAVMVVLFGGSLATAAGRASAQELDGNVYTDEEYGWSVEFDDRFWAGEEVDEAAYRGLNLSFDDGFGTLAVYDNGETDPAACLETTVADFEGSDVFVDFGRSRSLDAPKSVRDAEGDVYTTVFTSDDLEIPLVFYIECREVDGGTLNVQLAANEDVYEDSIPDFEDLLAAIETGGGASNQDDETPVPDDEETPDPDDEETPDPDDEETPEPNDPEIVDGLDGTTYGNAEFGLLIEWDDREWTVDELEDGVGIFITREVEGAISIGQIQIRTDVDASDVAGCAEELGEELGTFDSITEFQEERRLDKPETDADAAGGVYSYLFTTTGGDEFDLISYLECRRLNQDAALRIEFTADPDSYEDQLEDIAGFLAGIQIVPAGSGPDDEETPEPDDEETPEPDDEETPEPDDEETPESNGTVENDIDAGELDDDTFADTALGYSLTFDDRVWTAEMLEGGATAGVFLSTDDEELFATITIDASLGYEGVDVEQCVEDIATGYEAFEGYSSLRVERNADGPEAPRDAASGIYSFTFTYEDDTEAELVAYIECRPIDDASMVRTTIQTTEDSLAENVDVFQEVLDGIEIDGGGGNDDETPDPDEETPDPDDDLGPDDEETPETDDEQEA